MHKELTGDIDHPALTGHTTHNHTENADMDSPTQLRASQILKTEFKENDSVDEIQCVIDFSYGISVTIAGCDAVPDQDFVFDLNFLENMQKRDIIHSVTLYNQLKKIVFSMVDDYFEYIHQCGGGGGTGGGSSSANGGSNGRNNNADDRKSDEQSSHNNSSGRGGTNNNNNGSNNDNNNNNNNNNNSNSNNNNNNNNNNDKDQDEDKNNNDDEKKQAAVDPNDYKTSPLSEIMSLRGICSCSGHCGNSIIKFSLLVYKSILDRVLDLHYFNKHAMITNENKFWEQLLNNLIFNDDKNIDVNKMYKNLQNVNKSEWFKDLVCLIYQMIDTLNLHSKRKLIDDDKWSINDNKNNWQNNIIRMINDVITDKDGRKRRVLSVVKIMFSSLENLYTQCKNNNEIKNESIIEFILNRLMKAIMIHNYYDPNDTKQIVVSAQLYAREKRNDDNKENDKLLSDEKTSEILENTLKEQFKNQIWRKIDRKLMSIMCGYSDDLENLTLMRMLIITVNFMVESEATLKTNVKCIHYNHHATQQEQLINEMKINGIYNEYKKFEQSGKYDTLYNKNRNQAMAENKLSKTEIACVFLFTRTSISNQVKSAHRRGETCLYRCFSQQVVNSLKKLKYFDKQSNFKQLAYIYSGISSVTFDVSQQNETTIQKFIQNYCDRNLASQNQLVSTNKMDYCLVFDTLTSTSQNGNVAKQFSEMSLGGGVVLKINFPKIWDNEEILCGDIQWLSHYPVEHEILVAPCMIWIYKIDKEKYGEIKNIRKDTKVFGAELRRMGNVSLLLKQLKDKMFKEEAKLEMKHDDNINDSNNVNAYVKIDVNKLNAVERKVYDCIYKILPNECDRYFDILQNEDCVKEENLKELTQNDLKEIGIIKLGHRKSLLRAFKNL